LLQSVAARTPKEKRYEAVRDTILNLRREHQSFINKAVKPAFDSNTAMNFAEKPMAKMLVSWRVDELRQEQVETTLKSLPGQGLLSDEEAGKLIRNHATCHCIF
jgi:hypothetical protein